MVEIKGSKVVLVKASKEDIKEIYYWKFEEPKQEAKKWNGPYIPEGKISREAFFDMWGEIEPGVPDTLIVKADGEVIGTVGCYWVDRNTNWLETGIVIYNPTFWEGGFGTEAYRLWIDYLFEATGIHRLGMSTWSGNVRMIKLAARIGMKEEARIREARQVDGKLYDAIKMGVLRREWEALR
ncbi:GNAT family N-acetyltransferase [Alteribacter natronophilus]|uniref:GNAT family N-acetyltransferase n=1 Tax=Alteribacter natronophilus TaxID=2583810 RepID=UPI00110E6859|nr:GNAT family protein [Alteribacter natronophilus]TMW71446.1 GNAT family N-acetyltransferase [Alteribacter natronophilus]